MSLTPSLSTTTQKNLTENQIAEQQLAHPELDKKERAELKAIEVQDYLQKTQCMCNVLRSWNTLRDIITKNVNHFYKEITDYEKLKGNDRYYLHEKCTLENLNYIPKRFPQVTERKSFVDFSNEIFQSGESEKTKILSKKKIQKGIDKFYEFMDRNTVSGPLENLVEYVESFIKKNFFSYPTQLVFFFPKAMFTFLRIKVDNISCLEEQEESDLDLKFYSGEWDKNVRPLVINEMIFHGKRYLSLDGYIPKEWSEILLESCKNAIAQLAQQRKVFNGNGPEKSTKKENPSKKQKIQ